MKEVQGFIGKLSKILDTIAGWVMVGAMTLVVLNIFLRNVFKSPILGTYEYVGFLTALMIGLSLAYCAYQNFHIAVGFVVEKLSPRVQAIIDAFMGLVAFVFLLLSTWHLGGYARSMALTGEVSPTTKTPFYPFIYAVAFGLFVLCLVLLARVIESIRKVTK
ncbi:MAG: TRAP transporter small permease [Candidatus Syntrophonatronum acetioxidans]|uniref:TRAP transporter small permease n=1 Tax=Candidatus Syntrophonatronum acetioxidans TaxID=1795816 RepID=A0A424YJ12_9FIRM|nr:MAG: TRAP transporter small permease [Candidatus Syntrophonatronum acetioxidans]